MYRARLLVLFLLLNSVSVFAQQKALTIDDIYDAERKLNVLKTAPPELTWLKDGEHYLEPRPEGLYKVDAASGAAAPFYDYARMEKALAASGLSAADAASLARLDSYQMNRAEDAALFSHGGDLFYYNFRNGEARRITSTPAAETDEEFSPDGRAVCFVRENDLYVFDFAAGRERALTTDGDEKLLNGRLDWVYEEELYGRGNTKGYWWSPDGTMIAFLQIDESPVRNFAVTDHIPRRQVIEDTPYPLAGDPNPKVKLGVVAVADNASPSPRFADTAKYKADDFLIARVAWSPDSRRVVYQAQNREQTYLDLNAFDARGGATAATTLFRETSPAWVEVVDNPEWLGDGSFLWRSERSGWMHIYHYSAEGKLLRQITDGKWEARSIARVDEAKKQIFLSATEHSHIAEQLYRVDFDGRNLTRLTQSEGGHRASVGAGGKFFIDSWSDATTPTQVRLHRGDGSLVRQVFAANADELKNYKLGAVEFVKVKTRDEFTMDAMMIKPPDFDPNRKYPVWSYTYSGPHAPSVRNAWGGATYLWHQMLAQKGYVIWVCDNRTASGQGAQSAWPLYRNFGELELRDLEDGVAYLKSQSFVDSSRIGLWGWSFGGFMTTYALTHSDSFKIGIAGGSVTDWANYDSIYTERYMKTPQNNPEGYRRGAPLNTAAQLRGKLLLLHGTIDDNVHLQNTVQLAYELQKANKPFQLMLYPKSRHGVNDPALLKHMRTTMTDFILANL